MGPWGLEVGLSFGVSLKHRPLRTLRNRTSMFKFCNVVTNSETFQGGAEFHSSFLGSSVG